MNDITKRFLEVYNYLKDRNMVSNPKKFAEELNISTSLFTEICKQRTNAGITPIQNLLKRYSDIDANWMITGEGSMLKISTQNAELNTNIDYKELAQARLEIIELKNEKIEYLTEKLKKLENLE